MHALRAHLVMLLWLYIKIFFFKKLFLILVYKNYMKIIIINDLK